MKKKLLAGLLTLFECYSSANDDTTYDCNRKQESNLCAQVHLPKHINLHLYKMLYFSPF